jgi:hypothetical protein
MEEALLLYAKFLKEFPSTPEEKDLKLHVVLSTESNLLFILHAHAESAITNMYGGSVYARASNWFLKYGFRVHAADASVYASRDFPAGDPTWELLILVPVEGTLRSVYV